MTIGITSAHVFPYEKLSDIRVNPKSFGKVTSTWDQFVLMILETDTGSIRVIHIDQECVTKVVIEASCATPELFLEIASLFKRHNLSIIYSKHQWGNKLRLEVFLRELDISSLIHDLEQLDGITKMEILELFATNG